ncbi:MAG: acyl-CoA thioesterase [Proteobacteria bacterium]|jgi:acyl-CoA thioester hydrolase|nr:acyl-CoA thioesterase [Pseudomonadota bacterium]
MSAVPFRHRYRVTYAECTVGNHVYYARYLDILERARGEFFRVAGVPLATLQAQDVIFPVVEVHVHYEAAARYDDELTVEVVVTEMDRLKITFVYGISNARNQIILTGRTRHVCTGLDEKPKRMPPDVFNHLNTAFTGAPAPRPGVTQRVPKMPV